MGYFVVYRKGINMQGIYGIFTTEERAIDAMAQAKENEPDSYHDFGYVEKELDFKDETKLERSSGIEIYQY